MSYAEWIGNARTCNDFQPNFFAGFISEIIAALGMSFNSPGYRRYLKQVETHNAGECPYAMCIWNDDCWDD